MKRYLSTLLVAVPAALLLWAPSALASTQVGQILVKVTDADGAAIGDVQLELTSPDLIGGARMVAAGPNGQHRFTQLPPGLYTVVAAHPMFRRARLPDIAVAIGETATVEIKLESLPAEGGEGVEEIVITGAVPALDTEKLSLGAAISDTFAQTVPSGRSYQGLAQLVPGVSGGSNPNVMGATSYSNQYLIDGINVTDPVTNTFSLNFNFDAIKSVEVLTGGRDAEYGSASGGVINVVTKSGGNELSLDSSIYYASSALQYLAPWEEGLDNMSLQANVNVGGPLIKDRLWYFFSAELPWTRSQLPEPEGGNLFPDMGDQFHPARQYLGLAGLAKLTWQPTDDQTFKLMVQFDPANITNTRQSDKVHPDAEREQFQSGVTTALYSETFLSEDLFLSNRVAFNYNVLDIHPQSGDLDTPSRSNTAYDTTTVNDYYQLVDKRYRIQAHSALTYTIDDLLGEHQIKVGLDASLIYNDVFQTYTGGARYTDNGLNPSDPNSISGIGLPYRVERVIDAQDTLIFGDTESLFVQDVWKPLDNLTIRPGLRFDSARMRNYEDVAQVVINTVSPRLGVAWDPFDDGMTKLQAGYYQYVDTGYLGLSDFAGGRSTLTRTYQYNPITEEYDQFLYETGGSSGVVGKDYLKEAFDQQRPRTHEVVLGVGRSLTYDLGVNAIFTYRRANNQWEDDEVNAIWNAAGSDVIGFVNGQSQYIYSLGALREAFIDYTGLELSVNKTFGANWEMMASYTLAQTKGTKYGYISVAFDRPANRPYEYGYLPQDIRHMLKIYGSYKLPLGFNLGGNILYQTGYPYNKYLYNAFFTDYSDLRAPRGYDPDSYNPETGEWERQLRLPDLFTVSLRLIWSAEEYIGHKIDVIAEISNLFNNRTATAVEESDIANYGQVTDRLNPLSVEFGLRYQF